MSVDPEQIKQRIRGVFDLIASGYDNPSQRFFSLTANQMIHLANLQPGEKVLDIATGTGLVAIAAAPRVQPAGRVHGIDLSEAMINKAQFNCQKLEINNVDFHLMDAEALDFSSQYFEVITCSFGLFFLPDMPAALKQWYRVLKPGGRIIFTSFTKQTFSPLAELFRSRIESFGVVTPPLAWQRLSEITDCTNLIQGAGFINVHAEVMQMGYHLDSENDWWEILWNSGFRGILNGLSSQQLTAFREQHLADVAQHKGKDGLWLNVDVIFTQAIKP